MDLYEIDAMFEVFKNKMKEKYLLKRGKMGDSWKTMDPDELWEDLREHVKKKDVIDIAIYAVMLYYLGE